MGKDNVKKQNEIQIFPDFDFARALNHGGFPLHNRDAGNTIIWDEKKSRFAKDAKGFKIVAHFPGFLREQNLDDFTKLCLDTGEKIKISIGSGADKKGRDDPSSYIHNVGETAGAVGFSHCQHAIGHTHEKPLPSRSILSSCRDYDALLGFMSAPQSKILSQRLNGILQEIDPEFFGGLQAVRSFIDRNIASVASLAANDPILMEGRSLIFNRQTPLHNDSLDCPTGWQFIIAAGHFTSGGSLYIPHLDLSLRLLPGDLVALRGRVLSHEIEPWSGGQRISMVNFTHESVWKYAKVPMPHLFSFK
ncbi:hypothetical protein SCHPADRAFT_887118 [Schizopora paradoxa]|uniref:Fe2OG dioxygenase domain-containing protein n=1 Tax=Schizopora paradoxa TaxID=27342 RepID=A0A0H2S004_9AGAM|nr:hypothetical protein SCHPADRAFT_887118 [Schizopora paradoxa]